MVSTSGEWARPVVTLKSDHLSLAFTPAAAWLGLRRHLIVPYSSITNVEAIDAPWPHPLAQRLGTYFPKRIAYGTFWVEGERRFYAFMKKDRVLSITLGDQPFTRIVVGLPQPDVVAAELRARAEAARSLLQDL